MSLNYLVKPEMCVTIGLLQEEMPEFIPLQLWPPYLPDLSQFNYSMWEYCKRMCTGTKYASLIWINWNSDWEQSGPSWIMLSLWQPFVIGIVDSCRSVMLVLFIVSCFSHMVFATGFKSVKFGEHSRGGINSGGSFCNNSSVSRAQWAFQVSQGSVKTLFRWGGKRFCCFAANLFRKQYTKFHRKLRSFCRKYCKKNILVSFWTQCICMDTLIVGFIG